jgi:hypothetical protein
MDVAIQFIEARRRAVEIERGPARALAGWSQDPIAIGLLMSFAPPLAVTLAWSSPRFSRSAQIALTVYGALMTLVLATAAISVLS